MVDLQHAKLDPASEFKHPMNVVNEKGLSREEKIDILKRWAYDAREMSVAEEENMLGKESNGEILQAIQHALLALGVTSDFTTPTKQG